MSTVRVGLLKRAWNEIPDVVASTGMGLIGIGLIVTTTVIYYKKDGDNRKYKNCYTVIRHDDPLVAKVHKD